MRRAVENNMGIIADNLTISNDLVARALERKDPVPIRNIVLECEKAGAEAIDINSGPLYRDPKKTMTFLVETVQSVSDLPILIDTSNPAAMEAGLLANRNTAIINAFTVEPSRLETILPLAKTYGCLIIGYLVYPNGHVPPNAQERLTVAVDLFDAFIRNGLDPEKLIIDPIIVPIYWQDGTSQAMEVLETIRTLPELLGFDVKTIAALSNFTSGRMPRNQKRELARAYLPMLMASGLDMIMMDVRQAEIVSLFRLCETISDRKVFALSNSSG